MKRLLWVSLIALGLTGCAEPGVEPGLKALVGGRLESGGGASTIEYAVVVIASGKIRAIGAQADVPVPKGAQAISAKGLVIRPLAQDARLESGAQADLVLVNPQTGQAEKTMRDGEWVP
jgi:hypothetical protein